MIVTQLQVKNNVIAVYIDGELVCSLAPEIVLKHELRRGLKLSQASLKQLLEETNIVKWRDKALRFISFRPRSCKELSQYLRKQGISESILQILLEKLTDQKLVDDLRFAQWFVEQRDQFRPKAKKVLEIELKSKGIGSDIIQDVLAQKTSSDELSQAQTLIQKKLRLWKNYSKQQKEHKIQAFLIQRGYSWDIVRSILKMETIF